MAGAVRVLGEAGADAARRRSTGCGVVRPVTDSLLPLILPPSMSKTVLWLLPLFIDVPHVLSSLQALTRGLLHSSPLIRFHVLGLLVASLRRLETLHAAIQARAAATATSSVGSGARGVSEAWTDAAAALSDAVRLQLPDFNVGRCAPAVYAARGRGSAEKLWMRLCTRDANLSTPDIRSRYLRSRCLLLGVAKCHCFSCRVTDRFHQIPAAEYRFVAVGCAAPLLQLLAAAPALAGLPVLVRLPRCLLSCP